MPSSAARCATGLAVSFLPRPLGRQAALRRRASRGGNRPAHPAMGSRHRGCRQRRFAPQESRAHMNMRARLSKRARRRVGSLKTSRDLVHIPPAEMLELLPKIGEEEDGQVSRPVSRKPRRRQAGVDVGDDPPGVDASNPGRKRFHGSEVASRHGAVRGQESLMPSSNGGQVPPFPDCALEPPSTRVSSAKKMAAEARTPRSVKISSTSAVRYSGQIQSAAETVPQPIPASRRRS